MTYVVDSHTLIWLLSGNTNLPFRVRAVLEDQTSLSDVPAMALAEKAYLHMRGRIPVSLQKALAYFQKTEHCVLHPMDVAVVQRQAVLKCTMGSSWRPHSLGAIFSAKTLRL